MTLARSLNDLDLKHSYVIMFTFYPYPRVQKQHKNETFSFCIQMPKGPKLTLL